MSTLQIKNVAELDIEHDYSPATKFDVNQMITERLMSFHDSLVARGQIGPLSPKEEWPIYQRPEDQAAVG